MKKGQSLRANVPLFQGLVAYGTSRGRIFKQQARLLLQAPFRVCVLISLRPTSVHTLGIPWVGTPWGLEVSLNRKTGVRNSIVYEHSLLAAEVGDEPVVH